MTPEQRDILQINEPELIQDIIPSDILCYLFCLTEDDREAIIADERNYGPTRAASTLLNRLKRRGKDAFGQLVCALREIMLGHLALLLDPNNEVGDQN